MQQGSVSRAAPVACLPLATLGAKPRATVRLAKSRGDKSAKHIVSLIALETLKSERLSETHAAGRDEKTSGEVKACIQPSERGACPQLEHQVCCTNEHDRDQGVVPEAVSGGKVARHVVNAAANVVPQRVDDFVGWEFLLVDDLDRWELVPSTSLTSCSLDFALKADQEEL